MSSANSHSTIKSIVSTYRDIISTDIIDLIIPHDLLERKSEIISSIERINLTDKSLEDKFRNIAREFAYKVGKDLEPSWSLLAGRLECCGLYCTAGNTLLDVTRKCDDFLNDDYIKNIRNGQFEKCMNHNKDMRHDYFSIQTLRKSYLLRKLTKEGTHISVETPQQLWMRVAIWLWYPNSERVEKTYTDLSEGNYIQASPTLFNSGAKYSMLSSCFLLTIDDSMESISKGWHDCAMISKHGGGIGIDISRIRHGPIQGTGMSSGIVPMLKVYNDVMNYSNQQGRRQGSATVFLSTWHKDIMDYLEMKKASGVEDRRARGLFYALWISDLFMKRVEENKEWSLFCPKEAFGLTEVYGKEFEDLYNKYEKEGKVSNTLPAREVWKAIILSQQETGGPFMLYKDSVNRKSNQKNLGIIRSSNLCVEIMQHSSDTETASCNIASVGLDTCVKLKSFHNFGNHSVISDNTQKSSFDYKKLERLTRDLTHNINQIIDRNYYPSTVPQVKFSNMRHRPMGIGVHGMADMYALLDLTWDSEEAVKINKQIFEMMYYAFLDESCKLAALHGPYETFDDSPASRGELQFDLWGNFESELNLEWNSLKERIKNYGLYNSLGIALMPTASSAQINGKNESFEMFTSNLYSRSVLSGQFILVNKYLAQDLKEIGAWTNAVKEYLRKNDGSIQGCDAPSSLSEEEKSRFEYIKKKYVTVWEFPQKKLIDMSADRGMFVCQSQSLNCFIKDPTYQKLTSYHFYGWKKGLKTGMYYLRGKAAANAVNYAQETSELEKKGCGEGEVCEMCSA